MQRVAALPGTLLCAFSLLLFGCKKESGTVIKGNFDVTYEIVTSSEITAAGGVPQITYTNGSGHGETDQGFTSGNKWSKTVTITASGRPFMLWLESGVLAIAEPGTITGTIYVNGKKKASATNATTTIGSVHTGAITQLQYTVQ